MVGLMFLIFVVFCVVVFGGVRVSDLCSFLCCVVCLCFWHLLHWVWCCFDNCFTCFVQVLLSPKTTTQKTTKMRNTDPTKNHNTENYKDEKHGPHQKPQHRKLQRWETRTLKYVTTVMYIHFKCTRFETEEKKQTFQRLTLYFFLPVTKTRTKIIFICMQTAYK
jgi:hypothetical protein